MDEIRDRSANGPGRLGHLEEYSPSIEPAKLLFVF